MKNMAYRIQSCRQRRDDATANIRSVSDTLKSVLESGLEGKYLNDYARQVGSLSAQISFFATESEKWNAKLEVLEALAREEA